MKPEFGHIHQVGKISQFGPGNHLLQIFLPLMNNRQIADRQAVFSLQYLERGTLVIIRMQRKNPQFLFILEGGILHQMPQVNEHLQGSFLSLFADTLKKHPNILQ